MNERIIKETANEILANLIHKPEWDKPCTEKILESFAQLIVKECVIQCEREWIRHGADSAHNQAIHGCINSIKQHFGVEE